jgi:hypothetical protein
VSEREREREREKEREREGERKGGERETHESNRKRCRRPQCRRLKICPGGTQSQQWNGILEGVVVRSDGSLLPNGPRGIRHAFAFEQNDDRRLLRRVTLFCSFGYTSARNHKD